MSDYSQFTQSISGFHLGFFVWGGSKDQLCMKHAKFLSPFLSINHQCTKKHKARVFVKTLGGGGGGGVWGGKLPPPPPQ